MMISSRDANWSFRSGGSRVGASHPHRATATRRDMGGDDSDTDTTVIDVDEGSSQRERLHTNCFLNGEAEEFACCPSHQAQSEEPEEAAHAVGVACTNSEQCVPHLAAQVDTLRLEFSRLILHCQYQLMSLHQKFDSNLKKVSSVDLAMRSIHLLINVLS